MIVFFSSIRWHLHAGPKEVAWLIYLSKVFKWFIGSNQLAPCSAERGHMIDLFQSACSLVRLKEVMWLICSNRMAPCSDWKRSFDWLDPIRWLPGQTERGHVIDLFQSDGSAVQTERGHVIDLIQSDGSLVYQTLDFYWWSRVYESLKYWRTKKVYMIKFLFLILQYTSTELWQNCTSIAEKTDNSMA